MTHPARAYGGKRATAPTLAAAGAVIPVIGATSAAAETIDLAGAYSPAGASAPTTDPAGSYSGAGASWPALVTVGSYVPVAGSNFASTRAVEPASTHSSRGANIPIARAISAEAEIGD